MARHFIAVLGTGPRVKIGTEVELYGGGGSRVKRDFKKLVRDIFNRSDNDTTAEIDDNGDVYANKYNLATYAEGTKEFTTEYIQSALVHIKWAEPQPDDKITIFGTKRALELHGEDLKNELAKDGYINYEEIETPTGKSEEELWEIFNCMYRAIKDGDELYVDITHSFRHIPIQMLAVLVFARTTRKNISVKGIYYGAFEASYGEGPNRKTPIFDLGVFLDLIDWSHAAHVFAEYGVSDEICELSKDTEKNVSLNLWRAVQQLENISQAIQISGGYMDPSAEDRYINGRSIRKACIDYDTERQKLTPKDYEKLQPLEQLLPVIDSSLSIFHDQNGVCNNLDIGLASIKWDIDKHLTQQGFTALDETVKTYLCTKLHCTRREGDSYVREDVCNKIINRLKFDDYWFVGKTTALKDQNDILSKSERQRAFNEWIEETTSNVKDFARRKRVLSEQAKLGAVLCYNIPKELIILVKRIKDNRNRMNHFGFQAGGRKENQISWSDLLPDSESFNELELSEKLEKLYNDFMKIIADNSGVNWNEGFEIPDSLKSTK